MKIALLNIIVNAMEAITGEHGRLFLDTSAVNNIVFNNDQG
jgi:hypothetical protein